MGKTTTDFLGAVFSGMDDRLRYDLDLKRKRREEQYAYDLGLKRKEEELSKALKRDKELRAIKEQEFNDWWNASGKNVNLNDQLDVVHMNKIAEINGYGGNLFRWNQPVQKTSPAVRDRETSQQINYKALRDMGLSHEDALYGAFKIQTGGQKTADKGQPFDLRRIAYEEFKQAETPEQEKAVYKKWSDFFSSLNGRYGQAEAVKDKTGTASPAVKKVDRTKNVEDMAKFYSQSQGRTMEAEGLMTPDLREEYEKIIKGLKELEPKKDLPAYKDEYNKLLRKKKDIDKISNNKASYLEAEDFFRDLYFKNAIEMYNEGLDPSQQMKYDAQNNMPYMVNKSNADLLNDPLIKNDPEIQALLQSQIASPSTGVGTFTPQLPQVASNTAMINPVASSAAMLPPVATGTQNLGTPKAGNISNQISLNFNMEPGETRRFRARVDRVYNNGPHGKIFELAVLDPENPGIVQKMYVDSSQLERSDVTEGDLFSLEVTN